MYRGQRVLNVDARVRGEAQPELGAASQHLRAQDAPEPGDQYGERGWRIGGRGVGPERIDQLVPAGGSVSVQREVAEQEPPLAAG